VKPDENQRKSSRKDAVAPERPLDKFEIMPTWDAGQYLRFADERTQPCRDLAARIPLAVPRRVIDLGCGPGNSTAVLAARWPDADIVGLDSSAAMVERAREDFPDREWIHGDISSWQADEPFDVVFSNAALQWVPNHHELLPHLQSQVAEGGALAVQVPGDPAAIPHGVMRELAASEEWRPHFPKPVREWWVEPAEIYYDILAPHSSHIDLWTTDYLHLLPDVAAIAEWYRGTGLRPYLDALGDERLQGRFLSDFVSRLEAHYAPRPDGKVLFPFRRLFLVAVR
jgi:trans-aconitate 2-methyltransferase